MKKAWIGSTLAYILFRLLIETTQMRRYHKKLNLLSEGRRVPHSAKMAAMGSTLAYIPLLPFFVRGRNRPLITTNYKFMNNS